jgi:hypothetical protein
LYVSREDYENRYGAFLGFLQRAHLLRGDVAAAGQVTPANVEAYLADLKSRVSSVTTYDCISKLKRVASMIAPDNQFRWLSDLENDLAFVMEPRSKFERFVFTQVLVEAGLTLVTEARQSANDALSRARAVRNGLMIALLALCPIRLKNFAALTIGETFKWDRASWWITLPCAATKTHRADDRRVHAPRSCRKSARHRDVMDFLHHRPRHDQKESRNAYLQDYTRNCGR